MYLKSRCAASALGFLVLTAAGCAPKVDLEASRTAIRNADSDWSKAAGAKNVDGFLAAFASDALFLPANAPMISTTEGRRKFATEMMANPGFTLSWRPTTVEVSSSGDLGYAVGAYELSVKDPQGNPVTDKGKYITVWKKQPDGQWKAVADTFNSDLQLAPPHSPVPSSAPTPSK